MNVDPRNVKTIRAELKKHGATANLANCFEEMYNFIDALSEKYDFDDVMGALAAGASGFYAALMVRFNIPSGKVKEGCQIFTDQFNLAVPLAILQEKLEHDAAKEAKVRDKDRDSTSQSLN